jgi:hypothetical protein
MSLARHCPHLTSIPRCLPLASAASEAGSPTSDASAAFDSCLFIPGGGLVPGEFAAPGRPSYPHLAIIRSLPCSTMTHRQLPPRAPGERSGNSPSDAVTAVSPPPLPLLRVLLQHYWQIQVPLLQIPFPSSAFAPCPTPSPSPSPSPS